METMKLITADNIKDTLNACIIGNPMCKSQLPQSLMQDAEHLFVPEKTVLLEKGKVADKLYLIHKGCLRLYFYNNGNDITFQFFFENDIVASFDSLYYRQPSMFYLESIEATEVSVIKRADFYRQIDESMEVRKLYEEKWITCKSVWIMHRFL